MAFPLTTVHISSERGFNAIPTTSINVRTQEKHRKETIAMPKEERVKMVCDSKTKELHE